MLAFYFARQTPFLRAMIVGAGLTAFGLSVSETIVVEPPDPATLIGRLAVFLAAFALPHMAISIMVLERDGRLDLVRLGDRSALSLFAAAGAGLSGPFLLGAVVALAISGASVFREPGALLDTAAIATCAWAASAVLLARSPASETAANPRVLGAIAAGAIATAVLLVGVPLAPVAAAFGIEIELQRDRVTAALTVVAVAALIAAVPVAARRFLRPLKPSSNRLVPPVSLFDSAAVVLGPVVTRGICVMAKPAAALAALVVVLAVLNVSEDIIDGSFVVVTVAVFAGVSLVARADAVSGRLDLMRIAAAEGRRSVLPHIAGFWLLPLLVLGLWSTVALRQSEPAAQLGVGLPLLLAVAVPLAVVEGWQRRGVLLYFGVAAVILGGAFAWSSSVDRPRQLLPQVAWWLLTGALAVMVWQLAERELSRPAGGTVRGWRRIAIPALMAALDALPIASRGAQAWNDEPLLLMLVVIGVGGWFRGTDAGVLERWSPVIATALAGFAVVAIGESARLMTAASIAVIPAVALMLAFRIEERAGRGTWSLVLRVAACGFVLAMEWMVSMLRGMTVAFGVPLTRFNLLALLSIGLLLLVESALRLAPRARRTGA